jgi:hypothetical protein
MRQAQRLKIAGPPVTLEGRLALSIGESVAVSGVGRSSTYEAIGRGELRARKIHGRTIILVEDLLAWLQGTPISPKRVKVESTEVSKPPTDCAEAAQIREGAAVSGSATNVADAPREGAGAGAEVRDDSAK